MSQHNTIQLSSTEPQTEREKLGLLRLEDKIMSRLKQFRTGCESFQQVLVTRVLGFQYDHTMLLEGWNNKEIK